MVRLRSPRFMNLFYPSRPYPYKDGGFFVLGKAVNLKKGGELDAAAVAQ